MSAAQETAIEVDLDASWGISGKLHGGYLLATMVEAGLRDTHGELHPHPLMASALFAAPPAPGAAIVRTEVLRAGRTVASSRVTLEQGGQVCAETLLTTGRLPGPGAGSGVEPGAGSGAEPGAEPGAAPTWVADGAGPPPIAPIAQCGPSRRAPADGRAPAGVMGHVELLLDPATAGWTTGQPAGRADIRGWIRLQEWDPVLAAFILADAVPPVSFDLGIYGWVPTLQLQVILRRLPSAGWQRVRQYAQLLEGGLMDEDCTLWDAAGRLTIQARQLTAVRTPPA